MINDEELNAFKNEMEALNKKLAELSMDNLKEVAGGNRTDMGAWLEPDECFRHKKNNELYIYEGPLVFMPISEKVQVDRYKPCTSESGSVYYQFFRSEPTQVKILAFSCDDLGNKSSLPYELRR